MLRSRHRLLATVLVVVGLGGCTPGLILFEPRNGGPSRSAPRAAASSAETRVYEIDCEDNPIFESDRATTVGGQLAFQYRIACSYQGGPLPWKLLGDFNAAPLALADWDGYRRNVVASAQARGCPAVAIRSVPPQPRAYCSAMTACCGRPTAGETIGAFCISDDPPGQRVAAR